MFKTVEQKIFLGGFVFFVLAAYYSVGYLHPDEHFQILEFANYKLGNSLAADLPWEFEAEIRPALPVILVAYAAKLFQLIGVENPFVLTFILRLIAGLSIWYVFVRLSKHLRQNFKSEKAYTLFLVLLFFTWFMPYISVRFSSENLSGMFLLIALAAYFKSTSVHGNKQIFVLLLVGLCLGFSFYFRFQMAFSLLGFAAFLVLIDKIKWLNFVWLILGGFVAIGLSILVDFWFYQSWVFTPLNYFTANVTNDIASSYGVSPWWYYFTSFLLIALPPISVALFLFFVVGVKNNLKNIFVWLFIPFLMGHILIGHKEIRFLFPLVFAFLYLSALGIDHFISLNRLKKFSRICLIFLISINVLALLYRTFSPAREQMVYQQFLYAYAEQNKIDLLVLEESIYETSTLKINFYKSPNVHCLVFENRESVENYLLENKLNKVHYIERRKSEELILPNYTSSLVYSFIPDWVQAVNINDWTSRAVIWKIKKLELK